MAKVNMAIVEAKVSSMLEGRSEASSASLSRSTGIPVHRVREMMAKRRIKDVDV